MFKGYAVMMGGTILAFICANMGPSYEGLGWFFGYAGVFGGIWLMWQETYGGDKKD